MMSEINTIPLASTPMQHFYSKKKTPMQHYSSSTNNALSPIPSTSPTSSLYTSTSSSMCIPFHQPRSISPSHSTKYSLNLLQHPTNHSDPKARTRTTTTSNILDHDNAPLQAQSVELPLEADIPVDELHLLPPITIHLEIFHRPFPAPTGGEKSQRRRHEDKVQSLKSR